MPKPSLRTHVLPAGLLLAAFLAGPARAGESPPAPGALVVESCVSEARIVFGADDLRAMLDEAERAAVFDQLLQRYPVVQRDGVVPSHIVLWQQGGGAWLYVTLLQHPRDPAQWCFTASFVAHRLELTSALLRKYFALRAA